MTDFTLDRIALIINVTRFHEKNNDDLFVCTTEEDYTEEDYKNFIRRVITHCPEQEDTVIPLTLIYMHYIIEYEKINVSNRNVNKLFAIAFHMSRKYTFNNCLEKRYSNSHMSTIFKFSALSLFYLEQYFLRVFWKHGLSMQVEEEYFFYVQSMYRIFPQLYL